MLAARLGESLRIAGRPLPRRPRSSNRFFGEQRRGSQATLKPVILPFPTRIPVLIAFLCTCGLVLVELLEGTEPRYSGMVFCFFMLSVFAFNAAGGFSRPSGAYIFFYSVLAVELGTVYKAILGEPAQSNLQTPLLAMSLYVASIAGMLVAVYLARRLATTTTGIAGMLQVKSFNYYEAALGCLALYFLMTYAPYFLPAGGGQIFHSFLIVNPFAPLTLLLGTIAAVHDSKGWRSTNALTVFAMLYFFWQGMLSFSKQGMLTPVACWVIGLAWSRFRLRFVHLAFLGAFIVFNQMVLVPMAQIGRDDLVTGSVEERTALVEHFLTDIPGLRHRAASFVAPPDLDTRMFYYNKPQGILDRLTMMPNDSVLMQWTDQGHLFGYLAIRWYFENWVPHLIDPHKLEGIRVGGNAYMHEMNGLAEADTTTGISFSPTAEAFHIDGWRGVLLLAPAVWFLLFVTSDATCGDIRRQPLGLLYVLVFAHIAPEGLLGGAIEMVRTGNIGFTVGVFFCGYIAPIVGTLLQGRVVFQGAPTPAQASPGAFRPGALGTP